MTNGLSAGAPANSLGEDPAACWVPLKFTLGTSAAIVKAVACCCWLICSTKTARSTGQGICVFATGLRERLRYRRISPKRSIF